MCAEKKFSTIYRPRLNGKGRELRGDTTEIAADTPSQVGSGVEWVENWTVFGRDSREDRRVLKSFVVLDPPPCPVQKGLERRRKKVKKLYGSAPLFAYRPGNGPIPINRDTRSSEK